MSEKYYSLSQLKSITRTEGNQWTGPYERIHQDDLKKLKPADVRPVVRGHWIRHLSDLFPFESTIECDQCHEEQPIATDENFCPNCGADMRTIGQRLSDNSAEEDLFPELTAEEKARNKAEAKRMIGGANG